MRRRSTVVRERRITGESGPERARAAERTGEACEPDSDEKGRLRSQWRYNSAPISTSSIPDTMTPSRTADRDEP